MSDDDVTRSPLWEALTAPGTPDELAGEGAALSAFRAAAVAERSRRRRHRFGVGGAGLLLFVGVGTGVAAAVTGNLPDPVQDAVHSALGDVGVPASHGSTATATSARVAPPRGPLGAPAPRTSAAPSSSPRAGAAPVASGGIAPRPVVTASAAPSAVVDVTTAPSGSPSASPSPSPVTAPTMTASTSAGSVPVRSTVTVNGRLLRGTHPMAGRTVYLARRYPGETTWTRIGQGTTDAQGRVHLTTGALARTVVLRLSGGGDTSAGHTVVVVPAVAVRVTAPDARHRVLHVTTDGCVPKDAVVLQRLVGTTWKTVQQGTLGAQSGAAFTVAAPTSGQKVRYRVIVKATSRHGQGLHSLTIATP